MKRFKEFLLLEADHRSKIEKFVSRQSTLSNEWARELFGKIIATLAHSVSKKHSILIANILMKDHDIKTDIISDKLYDGGFFVPKNEDEMNKALGQFIKKHQYTLQRKIYGLSEFIEVYVQQRKPLPMRDFKDMRFEQIRDYVRVYNHAKRWIEESGEFDSSMNSIQAHRAADTWYSEGDKSAEVKEGEILTIFDGEKHIDIDGKKYMWVDLKTKECRAEGRAAGHCGRAEIGTLFSLRTPDGEVALTADIRKPTVAKKSIGDITIDGIAGQIYGRANTKPKDKYHKAILYILGHFKIKQVHPTNWNQESFNPEKDLSKENMEWYKDKFGLELYTIADD